MIERIKRFENKIVRKYGLEHPLTILVFRITENLYSEPLEQSGFVATEHFSELKS